MTKLIVALRNFANAPINTELNLDSAVWFRSLPVFIPTGSNYVYFAGFLNLFISDGVIIDICFLECQNSLSYSGTGISNALYIRSF